MVNHQLTIHQVKVWYFLRCTQLSLSWLALPTTNSYPSLVLQIYTKNHNHIPSPYKTHNMICLSLVQVIPFSKFHVSTSTVVTAIPFPKWSLLPQIHHHLTTTTTGANPGTLQANLSRTEYSVPSATASASSTALDPISMCWVLLGMCILFYYLQPHHVPALTAQSHVSTFCLS